MERNGKEEIGKYTGAEGRKKKREESKRRRRRLKE